MSPFREKYTVHFGIDNTEYESHLRRCYTSKRYKLMAPLMQVMAPKVAKEEALLIENLGNMEKLADFLDDLERYHEHSVKKAPLRRLSGFHLRVTCLANLGSRLLGECNWGDDYVENADFPDEQIDEAQVYRNLPPPKPKKKEEKEELHLSLREGAPQKRAENKNTGNGDPRRKLSLR